MTLKTQKASYISMVKPEHKVVILGEVSHHSAAFKTEVIRALAELKQLGYTHLGLEMLPSDVPANIAQAIQHMKNYWNGHEIVIAEAARLNIKIVGLDMPYSQQSQIADHDEQYLQRNHHMAKQAQTVLRSGHRMMVYMHYGHSINGTSRNNTPTKNGFKSLMQSAGYPTLNIQLQGGELTDNGICSKGGILPISIQAQKSNQQNSRFAVNTAGKNTGTDYSIHLPQNCAVK